MPERGKQFRHSENPDGSYFREEGGGRVTGRPSPRLPRRANRMDTILVEQGLKDIGDITPGQGNLLDPGPYTIPDEEMARRHGVPSRRPSSGEGFMPGLGSVAGTEDPKLRQRIAQRKVNAIANVGKAMETPTSTPVRDAIASRRSYVRDRPAKWYGEQAGREISAAAARQGVPEAEMRRATAHMSAQQPWTMGHPQEGNFRYSNVELAEGAARQTKEAVARSSSSQVNPRKVAEEMTPPPGVRPQTKGVREKAAKVFLGQEDPASPIPTKFEKVPNFDLALASGHSSQAVRRQATQAYTSDTHDVRTAGLPDYSVMDRVGGYDVVAMTGRRAAMQEGKTPSQMQENIWETRVGNQFRARGPSGKIVPVDPAGGTKQRLMTREGKIRPNAKAQRPAR